MALLKILILPDPRLRTVAKTVELVDDSIKKLTQDMLETMYQGSGIGLAATQVNVHKRVIVLDISESKDCLLYTSPSQRDVEESRIPAYALKKK